MNPIVFKFYLSMPHPAMMVSALPSTVVYVLLIDEFPSFAVTVEAGPLGSELQVWRSGPENLSGFRPDSTSLLNY